MMNTLFPSDNRSIFLEMIILTLNTTKYSDYALLMLTTKKCGCKVNFWTTRGEYR